MDLVIKNKNVEGGLGIHFFKNAVHGGDWNFQERLHNAKWLNKMLPTPAPLSTMRVITSSSWTMGKHGHKVKEAKYRVYNRAGEVVEDETMGTVFNLDKQGSLAEAEKYIGARSAVLRLGRAGAATDHSSVLFDVDINTGKVLQGTSNQQWYKLGLHQAAPGRVRGYPRVMASPATQIWIPPSPRLRGRASLIWKKHVKWCFYLTINFSQMFPWWVGMWPFVLTASICSRST